MLEAGGVISLVGAGGKTSLMFRLAQELSAEGATVLTTTTTRIFMPGQGQSRCVILADTAEKILERAAQELNEQPAPHGCRRAERRSGETRGPDA